MCLNKNLARKNIVHIVISIWSLPH
ncbi:hypothetical protein RDI58_026613 [Solanum bulbocastanum]|uniref:Uncharacterized protein n=1 Tax=Solanum bulbocastanum TaxID=147425 RepID=A0AAN8SWQ2_SOLBU